MQHVSASRSYCRVLGILFIVSGCTIVVEAHQAESSAGAIAQIENATGAKAHAPRHSADEIARWNDRTTPRRMLETFFFAIFCYDRAPELIANAIDCMNYSGIGKETCERDAALMAHELNSIITRQDVALYSVPDEKDVRGGTCVLVDRDPIHIGLERQADGKWRFDAQTVKRIATMRLESFRGQREIQESRMKLAAGRTDPEATMRSFAAEAARRDFNSAARCLDLRDVPLKLRAVRGPEMARKLAFVIQRCGFVFPQEIISDPDGWRYIWHSNHRGRIMIDRVRQNDDKDAWLFSRQTLQNLDALVDGYRNAPPDPRYEFLRAVIDAGSLTEADKKSAPPPQGVLAELGSARATLRTFLEGMDDLEFDDARTRLVLSCLNLGEVAESDRASVGLRLAAKLDAVLQHLNIDLMCVPDSWQADPQTFGQDTVWQVTLALQGDGGWRFDPDTIARVPDMFDRLSPAEKSRKDRDSRFGSARQTMRTFLRATARGDDPLAGRAIDLSAIPVRARSDIGPMLARKLKFVIDQIGPVRLQEIPNEAEGPRYVFYRGPLGRISLEPRSAGDHKGDWLFTAETMAQIEPMFLAALERGADQSSARAGVSSDPITVASIGILLRQKLPGWIQVPILGLDLYQWVGLVLIVLLAGGIAWAVFRILNLVVRHSLQRFRFDLSDEFVRSKLRPLAWQLALFLAAEQLSPLDLPVALWGRVLPVLKFLWIGLFAWMAIRLVDLGMAIYTNSEHLQHRRNLSDMIVPMSARVLKLAMLLVAVSWEVYLVGNGEWVTRLLAGLGLVGLAASLAAQDTLKSFFGTLLLIGEHPFKIGDYIVVSNMEGTVESVGFRSTWIRTLDDSLITIPNSIIANVSIDNRGARNSRRYRAFVGVAYDTPADRLIALRDGLRAYAKAHPKIRTDKIDIYIHTLNSATVDLLVNVYFTVGTSAEELAARDELNREILEQAARFGVQVSPPSQTLLLSHSPESTGAIPPPKLSISHKRPADTGHGDSVMVRLDS
jgi:MscS family membrane protein